MDKKKKHSVSTLKISDIMTTKIIATSFEVSIEAAMNLLIVHKVSGVPVVEGASKRLLTIVSEADLIRFAAMRDISTSLIEFIDKLPNQKDLRTASPDDPFSKVYEQFLKTPFRRIPIVDKEGVVVGIVSRRDIMKAFLANK